MSAKNRKTTVSSRRKQKTSPGRKKQSRNPIKDIGITDSTASPKPTVDELLGKLGDESLQRSHKSVLISFSQMLVYIENIIDADTKRSNTPEGESQKNIVFLLRTYQEMAQKFYAQFEQSLLEEIENYHSLQSQANLVISQIDQNLGVENKKVRDAMDTARNLLVRSRESAALDQKKLVGEFPTLMQKALDKLKDEWQRLNTIATAGKTLAEDKKLVRALILVAKAAAYFVGVEAEQVVVVPGNSFALYFFSYLKNFAVLTVPIYSVRSPWEWSIFWHELAGYKVRQLENTAAVEGVRRRLAGFHSHYKEMKEGEKNAWIEEVTRHNQYDSTSKLMRQNQFSHNYLSKVFSRKSLTLTDLGGFEHQFERTLARLPRRNKFKYYEQIKSQGWRVDWFKELFEDAWSVLAIREPFLDFFQDILSRHVANDGRHPPLPVRISVAKEILKLMDPKSTLENEPSPIEKAAAEQILSFISLLIAASPNFDSTAVSESKSFANLVRYSLPDVVGTGIGESIKDWSMKYLMSSDRVAGGQKGARDFLQTFSDEQLSDFINFVTDADKGEEDQAKPSYESLFDKKNYKELLDLSFYDVDFGAPLNTFLFKYKDIFYSITSINLQAAINSKFFFTSQQLNSDQIAINGRLLWTTSANIDSLKDPARKWITVTL